MFILWQLCSTALYWIQLRYWSQHVHVCIHVWQKNKSRLSSWRERWRIMIFNESGVFLLVRFVSCTVLIPVSVSCHSPCGHHMSSDFPPHPNHLSSTLYYQTFLSYLHTSLFPGCQVPCGLLSSHPASYLFFVPVTWTHPATSFLASLQLGPPYLCSIRQLWQPQGGVCKVSEAVDCTDLEATSDGPEEPAASPFSWGTGFWADWASPSVKGQQLVSEFFHML